MAADSNATLQQTPVNEDTQEYSVLFADIVGSSKLYQELGNLRAQQTVENLLSLMTQVTHAHGGQLVKTIGDEIMVIFEDAECAAEAAIANNLKIQEQGHAIRSGMAYGTLIFDGPDAFGNTVNRAASLVSAANTKQILVDQALYEQLPMWLLSCCELYDRLVLKGSDNKALVYRLNWQEDAGADITATQVSGSLVSSKTHTATELELVIQGKKIIFNSDDEDFTIGRDPSSAQYVLPDPKVSRHHCSFSFHRGKFIFTDTSTNGSYVQEEDQPQLYVRGESLPLLRKGRIALGQPALGELNVIYFRHL
ncbi:Adenylate cyclase, class 3 [Alteromonadaceae bacterium Bs31]|nr:Adenylate cyclase, class 3 [Alteromonadaceae bacterium Bs31]